MSVADEPPGAPKPWLWQVEPGLDASVHWDWTPEVLLVVADRSLRSVLRRMDETDPTWVVVVRSAGGNTYYYAYRGPELREHAASFSGQPDLPLLDALDMHEWMSSATSRNGRLCGAPRPGRGPASERIVDLDATGRVVAIGEPRKSAAAKDRTLGSATRSRPRLGGLLQDSRDIVLESFDFEAPEHEAAEGETSRSSELDLGPMRGGGHGEAGSAGDAAAPPDIAVTLSAETKSEIRVGADEVVAFRIELSSEAVPLAVSREAAARPDVPITVSLSAETDAIEVVGDREIAREPPARQQPRTGFFVVKGVRAGTSRLAVTFRQGGTELGVVGLAVEVVEGAARSTPAQGSASAAPRDFADDDKLALIIELRIENGNVFYQYILHSEALGLAYRKLASKPLLDRGDGPAKTPLAFVERIYERVTQDLKSFDDLKELQREARALGAKLSRELFDPEVAKLLWPLRERITLIQIVSWEPYIPWELVRLHNPDTGEIDERYLAEYSLVRTLSDEAPARKLPMATWRYLVGTYPMGSLPPVGAEMDYFVKASAPSLQARSIPSSPVGTTKDAFYDALAAGDFDVLHISCHAESAHDSIERASLIIGDATTPGETKPHAIKVDTITVEAEAHLRNRRPLVFLNACETGRIGAVLTAWGGWPNVFLRAGAGAFVGAAWAVRDKPAAAFSTTFYEALLDGKTLAEAASAARAAAKKLGDASWLAFKVYGHPRARRAIP